MYIAQYAIPSGLVDPSKIIQSKASPTLLVLLLLQAMQYNVSACFSLMQWPHWTFQWMPNYKGVANGIVVAGFGGGAFIFDQVQTAFVNPQNLKAVNSTILNTTQHLEATEL